MCALSHQPAGNLNEEITYGRFREDLYHRLSVVPISVPTLSERRDDIPDLIEHFMENISTSTGLPVRKVNEDALAALQSNEWPGNVRQLRNNIERLMIMAGDDHNKEITAEMLTASAEANSASGINGSGGEVLTALPLREAREVFEKRIFAGPSEQIWRQYFQNSFIRWHGKISLAS